MLSAILVAAGDSRRMGFDKLFATIAGRPVIAYTIHAFERGLIEDAYQAVYAENASVTDEVSAVERLGRKVILVPNQDLNFKITYPRDLALAEFVLTQRIRANAS